MAFALLTSVAPVYGLYTSFFPVVLYMLFGTGHHVSTGKRPIICENFKNKNKFNP